MRLRMPKKQHARSECACFLSGDIGQYDTCGHLCRYCYANTSGERVRQNRLAHDPESPLLIGQLRPEDMIHDVEQKSWLDRQISLFDTIL